MSGKDTVTCRMSLDGGCVKEEAEMIMEMNETHEEYSCTEHEIKSEVEIGPELLQAPSIYVSPDVQEDSTNVTVKSDYDVKVHSSCSVVLERLPLSKLRNKMVLTNAEKQKQYRDQRVQNPEKFELIEKQKNLQERLNELRFKANYRIKGQLHTNRNDDKVTPLPKSNCSIEENLANNSEQKKEMRKGGILKRPKTCEYCQRTFKCQFIMKKHQKQHVKQLLYTNDDNVFAKFGYINPEYTCEVCSVIFVDESDLMKHMQTHGLLLMIKQGEVKRENFTFAKTEVMSTCYYCVPCAKVWKVPFDFFAKHLLEHIAENPPLKQILKEFVSSDPIERSCIGHKDIYSCKICSYTSHHESAFRKHMMYPHVTKKRRGTNSTKEFSQYVVALPAPKVSGSNRGKDKLLSDKPANATNHYSPPVSTNLMLTNQPSILYTALTSNKTQKQTHKEMNESIDFQKSSLFSRLNLLNKVVGK